MKEIYKEKNMMTIGEKHNKYIFIDFLLQCHE